MNPLNAVRTRNIDIRYKWVIEKTRQGYFELQQVGTSDMAADGLTKTLEATKHKAFVGQLGLKRVQES
jgi:hypothetical protein